MTTLPEKFSLRKMILPGTVIEIVVELSGDSSTLLVIVEGNVDPINDNKKESSASESFTFRITGKNSSLNSATDPKTTTTEAIIGGETELRDRLNNHLHPKTISRATLYKYLEKIGIRKALYTDKEFNTVLEFIKSTKPKRKDIQ